ncbi:hypothetical protein CFC21_005869 [Triticum aestivum]|uniref:Uncharacterized protein n=2 Tax=Triticum aestivum TaxID=4565 RepID=A0A3B5YTJ0_WHEAT|nr:hypothetical protein CFC21_005869 [Triticum aestivum]
MHPELKAYLDDYHARAMARYDAVDKQYGLMLKILTGVSTPQPACPMATAADDGLTDDSSVPAVVPDTSSSTTKADETFELTPGASPASIEMVPVTCSTECPTEVVTIARVDEVHAATTTVRLEPAVDLIHQEVVPIMTVHATPAIGTSTTKVLPPVATTTDVDSKASVQELDALTVNTTPVTSEVDHTVVHNVSSDLTASTLTMCSAQCTCRHTNLRRYVLHPAATPSWLVLRPQPWPSFWRHYADGNEKRPMPWPSLACSRELNRKHVGLLSQVTSAMNHFSGTPDSLRRPRKYLQIMHLKLLFSSFSSNCQAVQLWSELPTVEFQFCAHDPTDPKITRETWWCLLKITYKIGQLGHLFRPRQWRSLKYDSVACYLEEPSSRTHHQPHEVSGFSVELVPLPFSDVSSPQVPYRRSNSMDESFCCLSGAKLQFGHNKLQIMSMSVQWHFLSQEKLKGSGRFDSEFRPEHVVDVSKTRIQFAELISLECCSFKCGPNCIPFVLWWKYKCLLLLVGVQHMILVHLYFLHKMTSTEALEKGDCQHLISTNCVPAYLKSDEVCVAAICKFDQGNSQEWVLILCFNQGPLLVCTTQVHWNLSETGAYWIPMNSG